MWAILSLSLCLHRHCDLLIINTHCLIARSSPCNSPKYQGGISKLSLTTFRFCQVLPFTQLNRFNIYLIQCSNNIYNQLSLGAMIISSCALSVILSILQKALRELIQISLRLQLSGDRLDTQILVYCTYLAAGFFHLQ